MVAMWSVGVVVALIVCSISKCGRSGEGVMVHIYLSVVMVMLVVLVVMVVMVVIVVIVVSVNLHNWHKLSRGRAV